VGRSLGRGWSVRLKSLVGGSSALVQRKRLQEHLKDLEVVQYKWKGIGDRLVRRLLKEQDTVFGCYYAATWKQGWAERRGKGDRTETHRQRCVRDMSGNNKHKSNQILSRSLCSYITVRVSLSVYSFIFCWWGLFALFVYHSFFVQPGEGGVMVLFALYTF
jgi:hypothetical protein